MPKPRAPERATSHDIFRQYNGQIENHRIADLIVEQFGGEVEKVEKKIAVWKIRDGWVKKNNVVQHSPNVVQQSNNNEAENPPLNVFTSNSKKSLSAKNSAPAKKSGTADTNTKRRGAPKGNKYAVGNAGGNGGSPRNNHALVTGAYVNIKRKIFTDPEVLAVYEENLDLLTENVEFIKEERARRFYNHLS